MLDQGRLASLVQRAQAADVPQEVAFDHEVRRGRLQQGGWAAIHDRAQGAEGFDQGLGQDHVAQSQRREQHFAEGPDEDYPAHPVHGIERGKQAAAVAQFAVRNRPR